MTRNLRKSTETEPSETVACFKGIVFLLSAREFPSFFTGIPIYPSIEHLAVIHRLTAKTCVTYLTRNCSFTRSRTYRYSPQNARKRRCSATHCQQHLPG